MRKSLKNLEGTPEKGRKGGGSESVTEQEAPPGVGFKSPTGEGFGIPSEDAIGSGVTANRTEEQRAVSAPPTRKTIMSEEITGE